MCHQKYQYERSLTHSRLAGRDLSSLLKHSSREAKTRVRRPIGSPRSAVPSSPNKAPIDSRESEPRGAGFRQPIHRPKCTRYAGCTAGGRWRRSCGSSGNRRRERAREPTHRGAWGQGVQWPCFTPGSSQTRFKTHDLLQNQPLLAGRLPGRNNHCSFPPRRSVFRWISQLLSRSGPSNSGRRTLFDSISNRRVSCILLVELVRSAPR